MYKSQVKNINFIDSYNHWLIISGYDYSKKTTRIKNIIKKKGNCYFAAGVSQEIINFSYRAVKKLNLTGTNFVFSKGAVKKGKRSILTACQVEKIDWDIGISVKLPQRLNVRSVKNFKIDGIIYEVKLMELLILGSLLKIRFPHKTEIWYSEMSTLIIVKGWIILEKTDKPNVFLMD